MEKYQMFIDGTYVDAETDEARATYNPATEGAIALVPVGTRNNAKKAIVN